MELKAKSFTTKADHILRVLKTNCAVCPAFDPLSSKNQPFTQNINGLWETGAMASVISKKCADYLQLKPIGKSKVYYANGSSIVNVYVTNVYLPNQIAFQFVKVTEGILYDTDIFLIGMDIISKGDLVINNFAGNTSFSFQAPSTEIIGLSKNSS